MFSMDKKSFSTADNNSKSQTSSDVKPTTEIEEGPYYMSGSPQKTSVYEKGIPGEKLTLTGHVLGLDGKPISHAWLDFWQANGNGDYDNSGYKLRGHQFTDISGKYVLKTVVPGAYPGRTPHIHVKARANDNSPLLTTQLFLPGLVSNKTDFLYRDDLQIDIKDTSKGKKAAFDFILVRDIDRV